MATSGGRAETSLIPSHRCDLSDLCVALGDLSGSRPALALGAGWAGRWTATWRLTAGEVVCPVRDLASMRLQGARPVRRFSWRATQRHRPGLQYLVSTGRHHGFESMAEQRVLLALDFAGELVDVLGQPFRLRFGAGEGWRDHVPDFLASTRGGPVLIDVRPEGRVAADDRVGFAASAEVALACGWRYLVVTGWRAHVLNALDMLSSQRRVLADPLGLQDELVAAVSSGPLPFGELMAATSMPVAARAHGLHLIWHRRIWVDLAAPLGDETVVYPVAAGGGR